MDSSPSTTNARVRTTPSLMSLTHYEAGTGLQVGDMVLTYLLPLDIKGVRLVVRCSNVEEGTTICLGYNGVPKEARPLRVGNNVFDFTLDLLAGTAVHAELASGSIPYVQASFFAIGVMPRA